VFQERTGLKKANFLKSLVYLCLGKCKKVEKAKAKWSRSKLLLKLVAKGSMGDKDLWNEEKKTI